MKALGILIILIAAAILIADPIIERMTKSSERPIDIIKDNRKWILYCFMILGFLVFVNPFVHNNAGERTYVQDPIFGTEKIEFEPGYHWAGFFARTEAYPDVMSTVFDNDNNVAIRFNDATQATARANVRWALPRDEMSMIELHKSYRSATKLASRTLEPYAKECLAFSAQLMESETHYSGGQSKLKEDFRDQLLNGQYVLETKIEYVRDTFTKEKVKITDTNIRRDEKGVPIRIPSDVQTYGIKAVFAAVPHVDYESIIDQKLKAKIDQSTKESIAKQELITAQQQALTEKAKGEQLIAKTRAEEEASKLQAVIQAEKEKLVAKEEAEKAKFIANKIEEEGRAEAAKNLALVKAGLTPQEKAEWDYKTKVDVARELAKVKVPNMVVGGGGSNGSSPMDAIGIKFLMEINDKLANTNQ
ncbi:MAG: hypothetical protein AAGK97_04120 [Bacteroidota bacterium]